MYGRKPQSLYLGGITKVILILNGLNAEIRCMMYLKEMALPVRIYILSVDIPAQAKAYYV